MNHYCRLLVAALFFAGAHARAQCPPNIGFENGSFDKWELYSGLVGADGSIDVSAINGSIGDQHKLFAKGDPAVDKFGGFPVVCPNGSGYSIRLGNEAVDKGAERISYTYTVPQGQTMTLVLNYAVVLGDPLERHTDIQQPRFTAKVFNVTDNVLIDCPAFDFIAYSGPGFAPSNTLSDPRPNTGNGTGGNDRGVRFKPWSATTINLEGYGGKTIRLEFTTNDCTQGGHFGYAYLDIDETCQTAITGNIFCLGQSKMTLRGPGGFADYRWYLGPVASGPVLGGGQTLTVPVPTDGTQYTLTIEPYLGLGCQSTLHTTAVQSSVPFVMKVNPVITSCANTPVNLKAPSVTAGSDPNLTYSYHTNPVTLDYLVSPEKVTTPGIYYIKGTQQSGECTDVMPVEVKFVSPPTIATLAPKSVQYPGSVDLTMPITADIAYSYFKDAAGTLPLSNYTAINTAGTYYIKAINTVTSCESTTTPIKVTIDPPAPFVIEIPNAFTPNDDGINDILTVRTKGFVAFGSLKIFNRYGTLMFTTKLQNDSWTGTFNGRSLPVSTYYWIFEGTDTYYNTPVRKSGSVAIIR